MSNIATALRDEIRTKKQLRSALDREITALEKMLAIHDASKAQAKPQRHVHVQRQVAASGHIPAGHFPSVENITTTLGVLRSAENGGMDRTELQERTGIYSGAMSGVLGQLVKDGRVEQTNPPAKRQTKWALTKKEMRLHAGHGEVK